MRKIFRWLSVILLLPINVTIIIPFILFEFDPSKSSNLAKIISLLIGMLGLILSVSSVRLFAKKGGGGTPAPWDPVVQLVISGPYRYVRNPMLIGIIIILFCESLFFNSPALFFYACLFVIANVIYFPFSEEPALLQRHGDKYQSYFNNVPRWVPRVQPYYLETDKDKKSEFYRSDE